MNIPLVYIREYNFYSFSGLHLCALFFSLYILFSAFSRPVDVLLVPLIFSPSAVCF